MRRRSRGTLAVIVTAALVATTAAPVHAGVPNAPIMGDFNADGLPDVAFLGIVQPDQCSVVVQYAQSPGVLRPPVAYTYLRPGGDILDSCPDIGAAFDWDNNLGDELWIGWAHLPATVLGYNRLILDDVTFRPIATFQSPITAVFLGSADFVGDGRPTPYGYGVGGFGSYVHDETGAGVPGPVQWCSDDVPTSVVLKDFDSNRAADLLMGYTQGCTDQANGVVVVLDDGTVRQLELSPTREQSWTAQVVYANDDRYPDVRTKDSATGALRHFINDGGGNFVEAPQANPDSFYPTTTGKVIIDVLANDRATNQARITITTPPRTGTVQILSDRRIAYTPTTNPPTTDRFAYRLTEDGRQSTTSVYVRYPG